MKGHKQWLTVSLLAPTFLITTFTLSCFVQAATITIVNLDSPGEGLNDSTPAAPVGGNPGTTVGAQRLNALQFAANLWGTHLQSSVEIRVDAQFGPLPCTNTSGALGGAAPSGAGRDFVGAPVANTWFAAALANSLAGVDLDPAHDDIIAIFNSNVGTAGCLPTLSLYYGFDASPPNNKVDFVTIIVHELAHGLGFTSFVNLATGAKLLGFDDSFTRLLEDHSTGKLYPSMTDAERVSASINTGNLHWVGANVVAASSFLIAGRDPASGHVQMFAPNPQQPGASVVHFSDALLPSELMKPSYNGIGPNHNLTLTAELFKDIGWQTLDQNAPVGNLENPRNGGKVSGISTISGWVCTATQVTLQIDGFPVQAAYGTSRADTIPTCGDENNGFGLLINWNLLGNGSHTIVAFADGVQFAQATFTVATLGQEFLTGASGTYVLPNFAGQNVVIQWQESLQNFVITGTQ